jgi:acyl transferase domain-containing protein/acyl carrier protein
VKESSRDSAENRARLARALSALEDMRWQVADLKRARSEPIAVIGLGCRYPGGVENADSFWRLLRDRQDAIGEVPPDRWDIQAYYDSDPNAPGKISTRHGGFLDHVDQFDPYFYGIAPREASSMDPQQRLLLEVAWEALEHAGLAADRLRGSRTGVFVGIGSSEYAQLFLNAPPEKIDSYVASGNASSVAAGRLSYVFGFEGPSLAVDTACSSSLVSVHLACQSLRLGECDLALAGGVNVILTPAVSINHSRARMLANDGRCKAFAASADGFVRSEGCGLVALKRLSCALADGDEILAEIRGSAMNQDGRTSGLTVPSGPAQQSVIRDALAFAGLSASDVSYVEAHGTGTALGDPIELNALGAVFAGRPAGRPLVVGSVKTNIGHAEAAAGVAGLIKVVLALQHEMIPCSLHFSEPTPRVDWTGMPIAVAASEQPWRRGVSPRIAGVSSFGFGGTNAHVVLSEPQRPAPRQEKGEPRLNILALSAQSEEALRQLAGRYAAHLALHVDQPVGDICYTANSRRSHLQQRLAMVAGSREELAAKLDSFAQAGDTGGLKRGEADTVRPPLIAFLCTGQGSQYTGMARELFETQPTFRRDLQLCNDLLRGELERPLLDLLYAGAGDDLLHQTLYTQPAVFALEYAIGRLWMSWGVVPDLLVGHSLGEYVAACLAGAFSLEDGLRLIAARARLMQNLPGDGAMAAVFVSEAAARSAIASVARDLSVAAINGPQHIVVSGTRSSLDVLLAHFAGRGVDYNALNVSQAFHSVLIEPMLEEFRRVLASVTFSPPRFDIVSNLTGKLAGAEMTHPDYWCRQAREPVRFFAAMQTCEQQDVGVFLEVGPDPVLLGMARRCVSKPALASLPSLRRGQDAWLTMLDSLGTLYVRGSPVDWEAFAAPYHPRRVRAPTYPFQRQRYWAAPPTESRSSGAPQRPGPPRHALLGVRLPATAQQPRDIVFVSELDAGRHRFLDDHRVFGNAIMPASGYIELALAAGATLAAGKIGLQNLTFHRALALPDNGATMVRTSLQHHPSGGFALEVRSRSGSAAHDADWTLHASGTLRIETGSRAVPHADLTALRWRMPETVPTETVYAAYADHGVVFGPSLRALDEIRRGDDEAMARIRLPEGADHAADYWLDPVWLDACAQVLGVAGPKDDRTYLQSAIEEVRVYRRPAGTAWCHARMRPGTTSALRCADLLLFDDAGEVLAALTGLEARPAYAASLAPRNLSTARAELYELQWRPQPRARSSRAVLAEPSQIATALRPQLDQALRQPPLRAYAEALAALDAMTPGFVADAFRQLGWCFRPGESFSTGDVQKALGVSPEQGRLLERLLDLLCRYGGLRRAGLRWQLAADLPAAGLYSAAGSCAAAQTEREMLQRCGSRLADVLTGHCDPLQLLFPEGERRPAAKIYQDSPGAVVMHGLLRTAIARLQEAWPSDRPLRILEVGAGTGGATAHVLPALRPDTRYVYTDISRGFFAEARKRFAEHTFIRYQTLDIERSPEGQGFAGHEFDVVIAFNVLHATRTLHDTVAHVRELLAPDGLLLLLENTEPADWVDLIWGLTPGWWRFEDHDLRPSHPLLSAEQWRGFLTRSGFADVETIAAGRQHHEGLARQALLIARKAESAAEAAARARTWLVLADAQGVGDELGDALEARGEHAVRVYRRPGFGRGGPASFTLDPLAPNDFRQLLAQLPGGGRAPLHGVIHLWGLDAMNSDESTVAALMSDSMAAAGSALHLVQAIVAEKQQQRCLWLVTRGAQPTGVASELPPQIAQAAFWGMGKGIAREHPELWGGMLDLDPAAMTPSADEILDEILAPDGEDQIAWRAGHRFVARVTPCHPAATPSTSVSAGGTCLITGGCGALGLETARWLVQQGCRHLALVGRSGAATADAQAAIAELEARGASVTVVRADVADEASMMRVLKDIQATGVPLTGIVHAAGLSGRSTIAALDLARLQQMFAAKIAGTWVLHRLTRGMKLDFFVCFSSMVSLWGTKEQCHYIAANHFVDLFSHYRRALGLPALCVNFGPLRGGGMLPPEYIGELERMGIMATPLAEATQTLASLLRSGVTQAAAVSIDWSRLQDVYRSRGTCRMFDLVAAAKPDPVRAPASPTQPDGVLQRLRAAPENERREILLAHLQSTVSQVLQLDPGRTPDNRQGFSDMGMDSLTAMELRTKLQASLATSLPATLIFDYGTLDALADSLLRDKIDQSPAAPVAAIPADNHRRVSQAFLAQMSEEEAEALLETKLMTL